jgi:hypothetical protein
VWSSAGPQNVMIDADDDLEILDLMGNPVAVSTGDPAVLELGESPVYLAGSHTDSSPVREFLAVTWDPGEVWSGSPLKGRAIFQGLDHRAVRVESLLLTERETGRELWSLDIRKTIPPGEKRHLAWEFPLDAPAGRITLAMEATLEDGRRFRRLIAPMVLGDASEKERHTKGKPWVLDEFESPTGETNAFRSRIGGTWKVDLTFPWFQLDAPNAERAIEAGDGFIRGVVTSKVGKPTRGKPGWIKLECRFDKPLNWLAFEGLRIRYRLDRPDDQGALRMDETLSAMGVHVTLLDADGNLFHITAGDTGLESFRRDGEWYIAELCFDEVHALDEKRAKITTLKITAGPPAQDENSFGLSLDRIELFTEPCRPKTPAGQEPDLHSMPLFDE